MQKLKEILTNVLGFIFEILTGNFVNAERHFVDLLASIIPYLVPTIPAWLTYQHARADMGFDTWIAISAGIVTESLGIVSISTAIDFYEHNRRYTDEKNKAPLGLAVFAYLFYLVVVITVNTIMEVTTHTRSSAVIWAISIFSVLSVPSGLLIAARRMHYHIIEGIHARHSTKKNTDNNNIPQPIPQGGAHTKHASDYRDRIIEMLDVEYSKSAQILTPKQITSRLKLNHANNKGFISNLTKTWKEKKGI